MLFDTETLTGARYRMRNFTVAVGVIFGFVVLRLFVLQVVQGGKYRELSEENRIRVDVLAAPRGDIRDRNGVLLADNVPSFTVSIDPYDRYYVDAASRLDSTLARLGAILDVDPALLRDKIRREGHQSSFLPVRLKRNVDRPTVAYVAEHESELPGVEVEFEPLRRYTLGSMASHLLGYVGEVSDKELEDPERADYLSGDLIGKMGIERQYERFLRGVSGKRFVEVNAMGRKAALLGDKRPVQPKRGAMLTLTIDARLQLAAEQAFAPNARGAAVAIDPRTGEVLALASRPNYDPNEFSIGISRERWAVLSEGGNYPLFNRAIQAAYPPGSTLKPFVALAGLTLGAIRPGTTFAETCDGAFQFGRRSFHCWESEGHGTLALRDALARSCDVYFYQLGVRLGLERLSDFMKKLHVSERSGIDLPQERRGLFPDPAWYDKRFGAGRWSRGLVLNLAIGQGEISLTPVKLAQLTAVIANGGTLVRPHLIRDIEDDGRALVGVMRSAGDSGDSLGRKIEFPPSDLATIKAAMEAVVAGEHGTGYAAKVDSVRVAGKTGTAQNPHGADHALFICFAPVENPTIAIAVLIENAGHGSTAAAPLAQKMLQAYFHPTLPDSMRVVAGR